MLLRIGAAQVVLPAQGAGDFQLLMVVDIEGLQGPHTQGAEHQVTAVVATSQRGGVALLFEAVSCQVHVGQVGERLQGQWLQVDAVRRFREHLGTVGIDLGFLLAADIAVLQVAFDIGAVPAVGRAATQAPGADFMPGIGAEMVAVDRGAAVGAAAHVQRRVAVTGHQANACGLIDGAVHTGEHASDRGGVARRVVAAVGLAPCAQCLDPHVATAVDGLAGSAHLAIAQTLAHRFAYVAAVIDQCGFQRRVDFPTQLLKRALGRSGRGCQQQAFIHTVARAQLLDGCGHGALVRRGGHTGEAVGACHIQLHAVGGIVQGTADKQVVGNHCREAAGDATCRLQDVVLAADQALGLGRAQQGRAVFQGQGHGAAVEGGRAARDDTIAAGGRQFYRIGRARFKVDVARHVQGANGIARCHSTAAFRAQRTDTPRTTDHAALAHGDVGGDRTVDRQQALVDQRRPAVGVGAGEHQGTDALLGQAAMARDVVAPHIAPAVQVIAHTLGGFAGIHHRADARQVRHELAAAVGAVDTELGRDILGGDKHPWAVDRLAQVDHAPAIEGVDARRAEVGGGGLEHGGDLVAAHVLEAFHQHRCAAGYVRRGHGCAVEVGVVVGEVVQVGAVDDRAVDLGAGRRYAKARRIATARREGADHIGVGTCGVRVLLQRGHRQPVGGNLRHKVRQSGNGIRVVTVVVITRGEDGQHTAAGRIDGALISPPCDCAEDRSNGVELRLGFVDGEIGKRRIAPALGVLITDADTPAVVDDASAAGNQRIPTGFVHRAIVAQDNSVFRARVTVFGTDDLRIERHAMHRPAIAVTRSNPADMRAVVAQLAIGAQGRSAVVTECISGLHRDIRVGVLADALGDNGHHFVGAGEFRMWRIHRLVEDPQLDALAGIAGRIGGVGVHGTQAPVGLELIAAPAGGVAQFAGFHIGCSLGGPQACQATQQRAVWHAAQRLERIARACVDGGS